MPGTGAAAKTRARPGQARLSLLPLLPPSTLCTLHPSTQSPQPSSGGRIGGAACLYRLSRPGPESGTLPRGLFACSGVLIKSFIVFHSRKELRRNTEQNRAEGREKKRKKERGGREGEEKGSRRETGSLALFFPSPSSFLFFFLSMGLKRCLIWSVGSL